MGTAATAANVAARCAAVALLLVVHAAPGTDGLERCPWTCVRPSQCRDQPNKPRGVSTAARWVCPEPELLVCCRDRLPDWGGDRSRGGAGGTSAGPGSGGDGDVWFPDATPRPSFNRPHGDVTKRPGGQRYDQTTRRPSGNDYTTRRSLYTDPATRRQHDQREAAWPQDDRGRRPNATNALGTQRPYADPAAEPQGWPGAGWPDLNANRAGWVSSQPGFQGSQGFQGPGSSLPWGRPGPSPSPTSVSANRQRTRPDTARRTSVSAQKCSEFARLQTERVVALPLVPDPKPSVQHVQKCDTNSVPLVVGGQDARLHEFPHMAAIGYRGAGTPPKIEWNCGGSLISELFVLTAAHCTATAQGPPVRVRLGEHNLVSSEDGARPVDVAVSSMVRHPGYQPPSRYHDIGLLRLARKVPFTAAIRPACLHVVAAEDDGEDSLAGEPLIATGWGHTEQLGERSQVLQKVVLNSVDQPTCNNLYSADASTSSLSKGIVADSQICAGVLDGGKDTCQGDSGGPLQVTSRDNQCVFHIVGITSFGKVCAARNSPGVYTRVSKYISWIERHVWPEA